MSARVTWREDAACLNAAGFDVFAVEPLPLDVPRLPMDNGSSPRT
jgi:hypothetical protein